MNRLLIKTKKRFVNRHTLSFAFLLNLLVYPDIINAFTDDEEKWLNSDDDMSTEHINEGKLHFLLQNTTDILHSENTITISASSIDEGWVAIRQCYYNLDKLPEVEITFKYNYFRNLKVISIDHIKQANINKQAITLIDIEDNAKVCVGFEARIFYQNPDKTFSLVNGPYHRRFLDGYYPYHVSLQIQYPEERLQYMHSNPPQQPGFSILKSKNQIDINTIFEGILNTEIFFRLK